MLHTVARFTPVEWVLLDACDLAGNPTEVVRLMLMVTIIMVIFVIMMIATRQGSFKKLLVGFCHVFSLLVVHHNNHHGVVSLARKRALNFMVQYQHNMFESKFIYVLLKALSKFHCGRGEPDYDDAAMRMVMVFVLIMITNVNGQPHQGGGEPEDQPLLLVGLGRCYVDGL